MGIRVTLAACIVALAAPGLAHAESAEFERGPEASADTRELPPYLQCVPFARERTGLQIYGDARTWWDQAAGRYRRGSVPKKGAVMTFVPSGNMTLGHVAAVAKVIDARTVLLDHANWSPINGRRGQIERGVRAVDVSPANDWSQVRVWYDPLGDLGTTAWPVAGFIYNERDNGQPLGGARSFASAAYVQPGPVSLKPSKAFVDAFAGLAAPVAPRAAPRAADTSRKAVTRVASAAPRDMIGSAIARYER